MVFQQFDNTALLIFSATDLLHALSRGTNVYTKASDYGACTVYRELQATENSACNMGITVYHQTHQR